MKSKAIVCFTAFLLIVLAGCNNTPSNEDETQPFSFSESNQSTPESEAPAVNESKEVETTPEAVQVTEPEKQKEMAEKEDTVSSEQPQTVSDTEQAAQPAEQLNEADKTETSETKPSVPEQTENKAPAPEKKPEEGIEQPVTNDKAPTETKPDFNIDYWITYAKGYAENVGLKLDSEAVYCWDNPIRAGAHCIYLERDIQSRLNRYKNVEDITAVWIWAEELSEGIYDLYIGYA